MHLDRLALLAALTGALLAAAAEPVRSPAEEARRHFQLSKDLYADGDLPGALNELERSYAAVPNYKLLYNMGQIQAQLQNHAAALRSFQRFLGERNATISDARRAEVQREIDKLRTRVAELTIVTVPAGAEVSVDDVPMGKSPLPGPLTVNGGRRRVTATLQNHFPAVRQVDVVGLDALTVKLELQPVVAEPAATAAAPATAAPGATTERAAPAVTAQVAEAKGRFPLWIPWVGTGVLAAGAGVAGVMTAVSTAQQAKLKGTFPITAAQQDAAASATRGWALATDVLTGAAVAAAAGSLAFTLLRGPDAPPPPVSLGVDGRGLTLAGRLP